MYYPDSGVELPANLRGYAIWLQVWHQMKWQSVCELTPTHARQLKRWIDRKPRVGVRIMLEKV